MAELILGSDVRVHALAGRAATDANDRRSFTDTSAPSTAATAAAASQTSPFPSIPPLPLPSPAFPRGPAAPSAPQSPSSGSTSTVTLDLASTSVSRIGGIIGLFVKCQVLAHIGWPLPSYLSECSATSTPPTPPPSTALLTIVKHTIDFDDIFGFTLEGVSPGTTSITTSDGVGSIHLIVDSGTTTLSEDARSGWVLGNFGCARNAFTTGFAVGSSSWTLYLPSGAEATCDFTNTFIGGQGGGDDGDGGGGPPGGGENPPGGGGGPPGGGSNPPSGGGNGPIAGSLGAGGGEPPAVLGSATTTLPQVEGVGGYNPEMPNTGAGGNALAMLLTLLASFVGALASFIGFARGILRTQRA